jgi:hypothetical protein
MVYLLVKSILSGIIIMVISEIAKRNPALGGMIASLPLISILSIMWLWKEDVSIERIANHAESTFWFVLPSLPMFLIFPALLKYGIHFWLALGASCIVTILLYMLTLWLLPRFGISI